MAEKRKHQRRIKKIREEMFKLEDSSTEKDFLSDDESDINYQVFEHSLQRSFSYIEEIEDDHEISDANNFVTSDEESENTDESLTEDLVSWVNKHRPSREAANDLLKILASNGLDVPRDVRTLVRTPRHVATAQKCGGTYSYVGIFKSILVASEHLTLNNVVNIELSVNIDGVPLSKSSNSQLWPILGSINGSAFVFIIGIFHAFTKPNSVKEYLQEFLDEAKQLMENGIEIKGVTYPFSIKCFICDCPARSFLKCTIGHNGINACERCEIKGRSVQNRTVFNAATYQESKRTDAKFKSGAY